MTDTVTTTPESNNEIKESPISVYLSPVLRARADAYAAIACGGNLSFLVRRALIEYLKTAEREARLRKIGSRNV